MTPAKPNIDANNKKRDSGKKGGQAKKSTHEANAGKEENPVTNEDETETEAEKGGQTDADGCGADVYGGSSASGNP